MRNPFTYILLLLVLTVPAVATEDTGALTETGPLDWPRIMTLDSATFVIHQPQIESWDQYHLEAQSAVAITEAGVRRVVLRSTNPGGQGRAAGDLRSNGDHQCFISFRP